MPPVRTGSSGTAVGTYGYRYTPSNTNVPTVAAVSNIPPSQQGQVGGSQAIGQSSMNIQYTTSYYGQAAASQNIGGNQQRIMATASFTQQHQMVNVPQGAGMSSALQVQGQAMQASMRGSIQGQGDSYQGGVQVQRQRVQYFVQPQGNVVAGGVHLGGQPLQPQGQGLQPAVQPQGNVLQGGGQLPGQALQPQGQGLQPAVQPQGNVLQGGGQLPGQALQPQGQGLQPALPTYIQGMQPSVPGGVQVFHGVIQQPVGASYGQAVPQSVAGTNQGVQYMVQPTIASQGFGQTSQIGGAVQPQQGGQQRFGGNVSVPSQTGFPSQVIPQQPTIRIQGISGSQQGLPLQGSSATVAQQHLQLPTPSWPVPQNVGAGVQPTVQSTQQCQQPTVSGQQISGSRSVNQRQSLPSSWSEVTDVAKNKKSQSER